LQVIGSPVAIQMGVLTKAIDSVLNVAAATDGTVVYVSGRSVGTPSKLAWLDRHGAQIAAAVDESLEDPRGLQVSPDGRRVVLTIGPGGQGQLWVYDLTGAVQPTKLTFQDHNLLPIWSPDGKQIAFLSRTGSISRMLLIAADGSTVQAEPPTSSDVYGAPSAWSPDGSVLLFVPPQQAKIWILSLANRTARQWLQTPFVESGARFSVDGRWVAY